VDVIVLTLTISAPTLDAGRCKVHSTLRPSNHNSKISDCTLKPGSKTHSALQQRRSQLQKWTARMSILCIRAVEPRCARGVAHTQGWRMETRE